MLPRLSPKVSRGFDGGRPTSRASVLKWRTSSFSNRMASLASPTPPSLMVTPTSLPPSSSGISSSNIVTCGLGAIQVIVTGINTWLLDKAGRRIFLIASTSGMSSSLILVSASFFFKGFSPASSHLHSVLSVLSLVGLVAFVISFSLGLGAIPWIIMSEILPVNIKGLAGSVATLANWLTAFIITMTATSLLNWSTGGTFAIYALVSVFSLVFVITWVPETKGRTLEEIQWSFR